jgi:hypothetical protein
LRRYPVAVAALAAAMLLPTNAAAAGPTAGASVDGTSVTVAGTPFFPVMLIDQCDAAGAANARQYGINLIVNESCPSVSGTDQLGALRGKALGVLPIADRAPRGAGLAGWAFPDEPENNGWTPDALRSAHPFPRGGPDGLLSFMTTGSGFFRSSAIAPDVYRQFARLADVAGFDLYPLGHCNHDLSTVYDAQRAFNALVGAMPTFQWIETGPIRLEYCGGFKMTVAQLRAEVWLAIAGGARGIGYFTHTWNPDHKAFDVQPALAHQMARTNALIAAVRPALVGQTIPSSVNTTSVKVLARRAGNTTYVIAVNAQSAPIRMQFRVPALRTGHIRVFGEGRTLPVSKGRVDDGFGPLAVHVYVQPPR